jgi:protein-disulfide isomerase
VIGGFFVLAIVAAAAILLLVRSGPQSDIAPFELVEQAYAGVPSSGRSLGAANSPVMIVEHGDYQCPGCGYFAREIERQLVDDYVATGKVRFEFRDYAFIGDESTIAAEAAACAADQGTFWQFHATLYHSQRAENSGAFGKGRLSAMAHGLDMDLDQFKTCVDKHARADEVETMRDEARAYGVTGTPSFVVNGKLIQYTGYESLQAAIDQALIEK